MKLRRVVSAMLAGTMALAMATVTVHAESIDETKKKGQELEQQKDEAQKEQNDLSSQLSSILTEMEDVETKVANKEQEIADIADELIAAQVKENDQYNAMKKRIKFMYENGNVHFIEILFESKDIGEFLNNAEYITTISKYDRKMLDEFQDTVKQVEEQEEKLQEEQVELQELQDQLIAKHNDVEKLLNDKTAEVSELESAISANSEKLAKLQEEAAAAAALQQQQQQAQQQQQQQRPSSGGGGSSSGGGGSSSPQPSIPPSGNGRLSNPCPAAYISSEFGPRKSPGGVGSTNHKGRDYAAPTGTPIYASASGTVTTVSYNSFRGNYVVVNHGNGLATLYQHCSAIYVSVGQSVSGGQNIAAVGATGRVTGAHLHFEVHVNGTPVDPRGYL